MAGVRTLRSLPAIQATAVRVPRRDGAFWRSAARRGALAGGIRKIWLDRTLRLFLDRSVPQIGAPQAWRAGYTGTGVKVAVLDSGVDATHADLAGRIAARKNFTAEPETDLIGHGTHVAATVASVDPVHRGVAPGASLLIGKVCLRDGRCELSSVLAAMEWASTEQHAKVVNLSLGGPDEAGLDPIEEAVNRLTARNGTLFVAGAGNFGAAGERTVGSPSTADAALSVGAVDRADALAPFSGRGPRLGDAAIKPDVTAPGVGIVAARSKDGDLGDPNQTRMAGDGTSMATPHVSGAAAVLFQQHPDWTPAQVKAALMASARPSAGASAYDQGAGRVDLAQAVRQTVLAEQPGLSFGTARWPHSDDLPVTRVLTYRNTGDADVTLALAVDARSPFSLSAASVTVPAGGTASVDVTADTRGDRRDGSYAGLVVATGAGTTVRTPVGVVREAESYDLTLNALDRDGKPTTNFSAQLGGYEGLVTPERTVEPDGTLRLRVPRGHYVLTAEVRGGGAGSRIDVVVAPWMDLSADRKLTIDARTTKPVTVAVQRRDAALVLSTIGHVSTAVGGGQLRNWIEAPDLSLVGTAQLGPDAPAGRFVGGQQAVFAVPGAARDFADSPYVYNLAWFTPDRAYTGSHQVRDAALASVRTQNLAQGTGRFAAKGSIGGSTAFPGAMFPGTELLPMRVPGSREELFSTEGVEWTTILHQADPGGPPDRADTTQAALRRTYRAGRRYTERWNGAVFGPSLPSRADGSLWANHVPGREMLFQVPLFGAAADTVGGSILDSAETRVLRDGTVVCTSNQTTCRIRGDQPHGRYRIETAATRSVSDLSTKVSVVWDVNHDGTPALPVQVVRFSPHLDATNSAPGSRVFAVPVSVRRNPGAKAAGVAALTVEASYDDGAHWHAAPVVGGKAVLRHPASGYVSLRATVTDTAGNKAIQTVIHAYRLSAVPRGGG